MPERRARRDKWRAGRDCRQSPHAQLASDMTLNRHTVEIDAETDVRLQEMAVERGQDVSEVLADAIALLDAIGLAGPDVAEDRRRLDAYQQSGLGVPLSDVKAWIASWGLADELPRPLPRKTG